MTSHLSIANAGQLFPTYFQGPTLSTDFSDLAFESSGHLNYEVMVLPLVIQELLCFGLITALFYLTSTYLNQHEAQNDKILKPHATFLCCYLLIKSLITMVYILHYQGTLRQGDQMVSCIIFFGDLSVVFLNIGTSLVLFKWLVILNRVYLYSGNRSKTIFERWDNLQMYGYIFFVLLGSMVQFALMRLDLKTNSEFEAVKRTQNDIEQVPSKTNSIYFNVILMVLVLSFIFIGSLLVRKLRQFYKNEYYYHSNSIILSIFMVTLALSAMVASQIIRIKYQETLVGLEHASFESSSYTFPLIYLGLSLLGDYIPIAVQILCIYIAIVGNWNELLQSELHLPDDTISVNSHMFKELAASQRLDEARRVASGTFAAGVLHSPSSEGSKLDLLDSDPYTEFYQETLRTQGSTSQLKPSIEDDDGLSLLHPAKHQFSEVSAIPLKLSQSGFCDTPELSQTPAVADPYPQLEYIDIHEEILKIRNSVYLLE